MRAQSGAQEEREPPVALAASRNDRRRFARPAAARSSVIRLTSGADSADGD
jgi:hypothetical protein